VTRYLPTVISFNGGHRTPQCPKEVVPEGLKKLTGPSQPHPQAHGQTLGGRKKEENAPAWEPVVQGPKTTRKTLKSKG
jgi:hypothetical protein